MISQQLKILFACSELTPWIKTGGLADVCGSLPAALKEAGKDVRIVLPGYHSVVQNIPAPEFIGLIELPLGTVTLCRSELQGIEVLLVSHESFTNRPGNPYMSDADRPWADNARRFALFSQAAVEIAKDRTGLDWQPDIVHCHDWQTGLVPALLTLETTRPATVFTIHNLAYQGNITMAMYHELNLPEELIIQDGLEFWGQASFIKGGIGYADRINTVSQTYAKEITSKAFGCGMEGLLQHRGDKLSGILNGVDTQTWNPATDTHIAKTYSLNSIADKAINKEDLQKSIDLTVDPEAIVFGLISRLAVQKGIDLIVDAIDKLEGQNFQLAVLGSGDSELQAKLLALKKKHPTRVAIEIGFNETLSHKIEAGADVFLMPSRYEPCGLNQMYSHRYGTLPLVTRVGGLADTVIGLKDDPDTANGFVIDSANPVLLNQKLTEATELFQSHIKGLNTTDPSTWRKMQQNAMQANYSWQESALRYCDLYAEIVKVS